MLPREREGSGELFSGGRPALGEVIVAGVLHSHMVRSADPRRLLLVHAHPDDESLTTGATIARYVADGVHVALVTCTLGEQGEIIPPELDRLGAWAGDQLGGYRAGELDTALRALGVGEHHYLGGIGRWRDSGMAGTVAARDPRAFTQGDVAEQVSMLGELLERVRPQVVVSYDSHGGYGHPDHIRAHEITTAAAAHAESVRRVFHTAMPTGALADGLESLAGIADVPFRLPAEGELPSVPDERITTTVDTAAHTQAKLAALRAHRTQVNVWQRSRAARCYALSNGIAQPVLDAEHFVLAAGESAGAHDDLFGGLRL